MDRRRFIVRSAGALATVGLGGQCEGNRGDLMKNVSKLVVGMGLLSLLSVMPLAAQIDNGVDFTTSFPFYAGNATMPAGSHQIHPSRLGASRLQIRRNNGQPFPLVLFS